jgi:SAM-dependent methyltransferase
MSREKPKGKRGLQLDKVVLLGRTLEEYKLCFNLDVEALHGKSVLDVASGVSSFTAEANARGLNVTATDPIYSMSPEKIAVRCQPDLEAVTAAIGKVRTYRWGFYKNPQEMHLYREKAWRRFITDYATAPKGRYVAATLPSLPFPAKSFDLVLVSYFLFVYQDQFNYDFHRDALKELVRLTRGEIRIYPLVTFEAEPSSYLKRLKKEPGLSERKFEIIPTQFEFLTNSNSYLRIS